KPLISERLAQRPAADWSERLDRAGIPVGLVRKVGEALELAATDGRDMVIAVDHPEAGRVRMVGNPVKIGGAGGTPTGAPPRLGEHTAQVLRELGVNEHAG